MIPDLSLSRSAHASACRHTAKTSALGLLHLRVPHYLLIVQSTEVFRFPRRLRPWCLPLSQRTVYSASRFLICCPRSLRLGYLRLCSHPLERLVMIVASLFRIFHPLGFLPVMSTICLFEYCPCRMIQFPILASTSDHDSLLQYFIQTVQLLVMISSAWIASIKSFSKQPYI